MHWTYQKFEADSDVEQGDLLLPTPALAQVLNQVHPHFCGDKYLGFCVTTQSCDLVGRPQPKAGYISIASVRSMLDVAPRIFASTGGQVVPGLLRSGSKAAVRELLERLLNQNEQSLGLFYLHPDESIGIGVPCVVFLRVTVALRNDHIDVIKAARKGRLAPEFQSKLGWLTGNLYSRVASPDWSDEAGDKALPALIDQYLDPTSSDFAPLWIADSLVESASQRGISLDNHSAADAQATLEALRDGDPIDKLVEQVGKQFSKITDYNPTITHAELRDKLKNRLANDGVITRLLRKAE